MSKKKSAKATPETDKYTEKLEAKLDLMVAENEALEKELGSKQKAIQELTTDSEDAEETISTLESEIDHLKEQLASDKGIPVDPAPEVQKLNQQLKQYQQTNLALQADLDKLKANAETATIPTAEEVLRDGDALRDHPDRFTLIASCIGKVMDRDGNPYSDKNFSYFIDTLVKQGMQLANAIVEATEVDNN